MVTLTPESGVELAPLLSRVFFDDRVCFVYFLQYRLPTSFISRYVAGLLMFEFSLFGFGCLDGLMPGWIRRPSLLDPAFGASQKLIHLAVGQ